MDNIQFLSVKIKIFVFRARTHLCVKGHHPTTGKEVETESGGIIVNHVYCVYTLTRSMFMVFLHTSRGRYC